MRVVKSIIKVTLQVTEEELISNRYLAFSVLTGKVKALEDTDLKYKGLRSKLYNSDLLGKLNTEVIGSIKFIDTEKPMKTNSSPVYLTFERV